MVGNHECLVDLPAPGSNCARIENFSVVGFQYFEKPPTGPFSMQNYKDDALVFDTQAAMTSSTSEKVCGETCHNASFAVVIPDSLAPSPRADCDLTKLSGAYPVEESSISGDCQRLFRIPSATLANGLLQMDDPSCQSQLVAWTPSACKLESTTTCAAGASTNTWMLSLTDLLGDGTHLEGSGHVDLSYFTACTASAHLQLSR